MNEFFSGANLRVHLQNFVLQNGAGRLLQYVMDNGTLMQSFSPIWTSTFLLYKFHAFLSYYVILIT